VRKQLKPRLGDYETNVIFFISIFISLQAYLVHMYTRMLCLSRVITHFPRRRWNVEATRNLIFLSSKGNVRNVRCLLTWLFVPPTTRETLRIIFIYLYSYLYLYLYLYSYLYIYILIKIAETFFLFRISLQILYHLMEICTVFRKILRHHLIDYTHSPALA